MKRIAYIIVIALLLPLFVLPAPVWAVETDDLTSLSLQAAIEQAMKNSPDLRTAERNLDSARYMRDQIADNIGGISTSSLFVYPAVQSSINSFQQAEVNYRTASQTTEITRKGLELKVLVAYSDCLKAANDLELLQLKKQELDEQDKVYRVAYDVGLMSNTDFKKTVNAREQLLEGIKTQESTLQSKNAELARWLNKSPGWQADLTSRPMATTWSPNSLDIEVLRGVSQSSTTLQSKNNLDMEKSKEYWPGTHTDAFMWQVQYDLAELSYEADTRTAKGTIQQDYFSIEALTKAIAAAQLELEQLQRDQKVLENKYALGLIPLRSLTSAESNLAAARLNTRNKEIEIDNYKIQLVQAKAKFGFDTGQTVYDKRDWSEPAAVK